MKFLSAWVGLLGSLLLLTGCSSFKWQAKADDLSIVSSIYVLIEKHETLAAKGEGIRVVDGLRNYPFYAQFEPDGKSWKELASKNGPLKVEVKGARLSLRVPKDWIEQRPDHDIVVVVRFTKDHSPQVATSSDALVVKSDAEYVITASGISRER